MSNIASVRILMRKEFYNDARLIAKLLGYRTFAEFVREKIRNEIDAHKHLLINKESFHAVQ